MQSRGSFKLALSPWTDKGNSHIELTHFNETFQIETFDDTDHDSEVESA